MGFLPRMEALVRVWQVGRSVRFSGGAFCLHRRGGKSVWRRMFTRWSRRSRGGLQRGLSLAWRGAERRLPVWFLYCLAFPRAWGVARRLRALFPRPWPACLGGEAGAPTSWQAVGQPLRQRGVALPERPAGAPALAGTLRGARVGTLAGSQSARTRGAGVRPLRRLPRGQPVAAGARGTRHHPDDRHAREPFTHAAARGSLLSPPSHALPAAHPTN